MIKAFFLSVVLCISMVVAAQNVDDQKYLLTTNTPTFGLTLPSFTDPYLSPMVYSGVGISYSRETRRFFTTANTNYSMQDNLSLSTAMLINPAATSSMTYMGVNYGWGANYHLRLGDDLKILAGGLWDVDFGFRNVSRNVNNPVNLDMATNVNLTALFLYDYPMQRRTLRFRIAMQAPIIGYMFVPQAGASYYDMFELGNMTGAFHFSSLYNKIGLSQTYSVDVPFNRTTWRFGLHFMSLKYEANDLVYKRNEVSLVVGTTFDAISFGGKNRTAPHNFISTNN